MTKKLFVAFSHTLTKEQITDAISSLGVEEIVTLKAVTPELQKKFSQVPADASTLEIISLASAVVSEAQIAGATHIYVAGEPSIVVHASLIARDRGIKVVQSTTERISKEVPQADGTVVKTAVFAHVQWREVF